MHQQRQSSPLPTNQTKTQFIFSLKSHLSCLSPSSSTIPKPNPNLDVNFDPLFCDD